MATTETSKGTRIANLADVLSEAGAEAYFASSPISMGYLAGFHEGGGERFLTLAVRATGESRMICPALSASQALKAGIPDVRPWADGQDPLAHLRELASDWRLETGKLLVDDDMGAAMLLSMQDTMPAALFKPGHPVLAELMRVKDVEELANMDRAAEIADEAYRRFLPSIRPGMTEIELEQIIFAAMQELGGKPTFAIVATGPNSAEPHHVSDDSRLESGHVVILDFGCSYRGYQSDITRTLALGEATDKARDTYRLVFEAHQSARKAIAPGKACQDIDRAARRVIEDAGYGEFFMHRTGHGIGMRGHEEPFIIEGNEQALAEGHCFSVEPGVYLPGEFGIRIENIVTVTPGGHRSLNDEPPPELLVV